MLFAFIQTLHLSEPVFRLQGVFMCFILKTRNGSTPDQSNGSILTALCKLGRPTPADLCLGWKLHRWEAMRAIQAWQGRPGKIKRSVMVLGVSYDLRVRCEHSLQKPSVIESRLERIKSATSSRSKRNACVNSLVTAPTRGKQPGVEGCAGGTTQGYGTVQVFTWGVLGPHVRSMHTLQTHRWREIYDLGAHLLRVDHYDELLPRQLQFVAEHLGWERRGGSVVVGPNGIIDIAWDGTEAIAQAAEQDWLRMLGRRDAVDISHT